MNPFMMQQNVPNIKDLWKNEVDKYRLWIILFIIGVLSIAILSFVAILLNGLSMQQGINDILNNSGKNGGPIANSYNNARWFYLTNMVIYPTFMLLLVVVSLTLFTITCVKSYKAHNFARLSWGSVFTIQILGFLALINIFQALIFSGGSFGSQISTDIPGPIFTLVVMFLYMPIWFFANRVSSIRKLFLYSEQMEKLKNDPNYQNMVKQMQQFSQSQNGRPSPFGFTPNQGNVHNPNNKATPSQNAAGNTKGKPNQVPMSNIQPAKETSKLSETDKQLAKLTIKQLRQIAKKLYIFGYETMSRDDLISWIKRATQDSK